APLIAPYSRNRDQDRPTAAIDGGRQMKSDRQAAAIVGILFIITWITSIPALMLYSPVLNKPDFLANGAAHEHRIILGAFLELLVIVSVAGTGIALFPVLRKHDVRLALGYLTFRV